MSEPFIECFPMGEVSNHLNFCIMNFTSIWELARPEKPQPIIKFYHLSYNSKSFSSIFLNSVKFRLKSKRISCFQYMYIFIYFKGLRIQSSTENETSLCCSLSFKNNLRLFQEQKCSCIKSDSLPKTMISLANVAHKGVFLWPVEVYETS